MLTAADGRTSGELAEARIGTRDHDAVLRVRSAGSSPYVLADKCRRPRHELRAAVVSGHARRRGLMLVLAGATSPPRRMTPDPAQQRGVLPYRQRQHDGKESCSKHVVLATDEGKSCASTSKGRSQEILGFLGRASCFETKRLAEFRRWVPKIPQCSDRVVCGTCAEHRCFNCTCKRA